MTSVDAQKDKHRFLVGTCSAKEANELHLIEFDDDRNELNCCAVLPHTDEVWSLATHPTDPSLFFSVHYHGRTYRATLWQMPADIDSMGGGGVVDELTAAMELPVAKGVVVRSIVFNPMDGDSGSNSLLSLDSDGLKIYSIAHPSAGSSAAPTASYAINSPDMYAACWDPHHPNLLVASSSVHIHGYDSRLSPTAPPTHSLQHAHSDVIRCLDYNPNKPYHILSSGLDRLIHIHDIRKPTSPLVILQQHSHWVQAVRYNQFHDQLILTCSTEDVALWSVASVSSAPLGELEVGGGGGADGVKDKLIAVYTDHEDSVYSGCWSAYDAWVFVTCSYDGRVVVNQVPPAEKYKILL